MNSVADRLSRALCSLEGLATGDAFGECFFTDDASITRMLETRSLPDSLWRYTDDTQMTLSVVAILKCYGEIEPDALAASLVRHYDYARGYGPSMHRLLAALREGVSWRIAAPAQFAGQGSFGNGAAMRAAPIGAYFADDLAQTVAQARLSAEVTHTHPEAIAGAIATAVAAALAWRIQSDNRKPTSTEFLAQVAAQVPESQVRARLLRAGDMLTASVGFAAQVLGNGIQLAAQDTVPFALWCAAQHLDDYEEALWLAVSGLGDRDTICAIVGGIVALSAGGQAIPTAWQVAREPFDLEQFTP